MIKNISTQNQYFPARKTEEAGLLQELRDRHAEFELKRQAMARQMESTMEGARNQADEFRKDRIAMEIARRIMRGDNVPQDDMDFLFERNPALFKLAMSLRDITNDDPEDHESLSEEERRRNAEGGGFEQAMLTGLAGSAGASPRPTGGAPPAAPPADM